MSPLLNESLKLPFWVRIDTFSNYNLENYMKYDFSSAKTVRSQGKKIMSDWMTSYVHSC